MTLVARTDEGFAVDAAAPSPEVCELIDETLAPAVEEIAAQVTRSIHSHLDGARLDDPERVADTLASCEANVRMQLAVWRTGQDPSDARPPQAAVAYARLYARENRPLTDLMRVYRIGQEEFTRILRHELLAHLPVEAALVAIDQVSAFVFTCNDAILSRLEQIYLGERAKWGERTAAALRRRVLPEILAGKQLDTDEASLQLGYDLRRSHLAVVLWGASGTGLEEAAARVAKQLRAPPPLTLPLGATALTAWFGSWEPLDPAAVPTLPGEARCAVGTPRAGVEGFGASQREALQAARGRSLRRPRRHRRLPGAGAGEPALRRPRPPSRLQPRRDRAAAPRAAAGGDAAAAGDGRGLLRELASVSRTARRLGVHENTVQYRLHGVAEVLGHGVAERPLQLQLALVIARLLPPEDGEPPPGAIV